MYFVGVDLAWSPRRPSGLAIARGDEKGARLTAWSSEVQGFEGVVDYISGHTGDRRAMVSIDAPLVVPNRDSIRPCDRSVNARFRRHRAGVYPANRTLLSRYGALEGERLRDALRARGYTDAVPLQKQAPERALFETYPHAAMVALFRLPERLPYKARGRRRPWSVREEAFEVYRSHLRGLTAEEPPLVVPPHLLQGDLSRMKETERKAYEDLLDAILCAYVSFYAWCWGPAGSRVYGSVPEGYMILPRRERGGEGDESFAIGS